MKNVLEYGYKVEVYDCIQFDKVYNLFDDFVNELYTKKALAESEGNGAMRHFFKLILNSNSGRWGLRHIDHSYQIIKNSKLDSLSLKEDIEV